MKSKVSRRPSASFLATRSCARFSPASIMPASARIPTSSSGTYFTAARSRRPPRRAPRARTPRRSLPGPPRGSPRTRATSRPSQLRHATPPWRPARSPSRRCDHGALRARTWCRAWCRGSRARPRPAGWRARRRRGRPVAVAPPWSQRREGRVDLLPVSSRRTRAPGPIAARTSRAPSARSARTPSWRTPAARPRQPACAAATASVPPGRRQAVRDAHGAGDVRERRRLAVGLGRGRGQVAGLADDADHSTVHLRLCATRSAGTAISRRAPRPPLPAQQVDDVAPRRRQPRRQRRVPPGRSAAICPSRQPNGAGARGARRSCAPSRAVPSPRDRGSASRPTAAPSSRASSARCRRSPDTVPCGRRPRAGPHR